GRLVRWLEAASPYSIAKCNFSPDGKLLAVGRSAGNQQRPPYNVGVHEVETGRQLFAVSGTNSAFAPDGRSIVAWQGYDSRKSVQDVRRVAVPNGEELSKFACRQLAATIYPWSDGRWFFEVTPERTVQVRDVATGQVQHTVHSPEGPRGNQTSV